MTNPFPSKDWNWVVKTIFHAQQFCVVGRASKSNTYSISLELQVSQNYLRKTLPVSAHNSLQILLLSVYGKLGLNKLYVFFEKIPGGGGNFRKNLWQKIQRLFGLFPKKNTYILVTANVPKKTLGWEPSYFLKTGII